MSHQPNRMHIQVVRANDKVKHSPLLCDGIVSYAVLGNVHLVAFCRDRTVYETITKVGK